MPDALKTSSAGAADEAQAGPDALYAAAVVLWRERRRDEAIRLMDEALRLKPDCAAALSMGGYMLANAISLTRRCASTAARSNSTPR